MGRRGFAIRLEGFSPDEEVMIRAGEVALQSAGYDTTLLEVLVRADMPPGFRAMTLHDGAALGQEAFVSQAMLNHALEEELLHLVQKAGSAEQVFVRGTARTLEEEVHEQRRFPLPQD